MVSSFQQMTAYLHRRTHKLLPARNTYSLRSRIFQYFLLFLAAFLIFGGLLIYYYSDQLLKNSYNHIHENLELYSGQLDRNLSAVEASLYILSQDNSDVGLVSTLAPDKGGALYQIRVSQLLANTLPYFSSVDGIFIYADRTDSYISSSRSSDSGLCNTYIKTLLRMHLGNGSEDRLHITDWYMVTLDDGYYLVRIMKQAYCYTGAWARLDTLTLAFDGISESDTALFYVSQRGKAFTGTDWSSYRLDPASSLHDSVIFEDARGVSYLQISLMPDFCSYYLMAFVPMKYIRSSLGPVYRFTAALVFLLLILEVFMFLRVNRFLARPAYVIHQIASRMQQGGMQPVIAPAGERCEEVLEIHQTLNSLLDEISNLKIDIYEEQITRTEFELEYLKSQVAPHFLINCFSTICSLANSADGQAMTQRMVQTLSDHLRYTLSTRDTVPLREELDYVANYLELTKIRFPGCLSYEIDVAEECMEASAFPLLLLMFTENTIKYNMVMGEQLAVKITGSLDWTQDPPRLLLMHVDSGDGFMPEDLPWMNDFDLERHKPVDGHGVGFYNILKRLTLIYGTSARVQFSNEPGWGARIDIDIPYIRYERADSAQADRVFASQLFDQTGPG